MKKTLEATIKIEIYGKFKADITGRHFMDKVDEMCAEVRENKPIKISIDGELGELIKFTDDPILFINLGRGDFNVETK